MEKDIDQTDRSQKIHLPHSFHKKLVEDVLQKNKEASQERRCGIQETTVLPRRKEKGIPKVAGEKQARE
jgi:hypothetical protein